MEETILRLVSEFGRRRYGKYRGIVQDNEDPKELGRLRVTVPSLLGNEATTWALPSLPFGGLSQQGMFFIPEKKSRVWIEFEEGDINRPIWTGVFWEKKQDLPNDAARPTPTTRVLQTPSGHRLQFDDEDGARRVRLTHATAAELVLDDDGSVELTNSGGMTLKLRQDRREVLLEDGRGNQLRMNESGWSAEDNTGTRIEMGGGSTTVTANGRVTINAPSVSLGGVGGEPVIKGLSFLTKYMTHTHTVAPIVGGPTSPPIPQGEFASLSSKVTTG